MFLEGEIYMTDESKINGGIDLEELGERYSERGFFKRLGEMFRGFKAPRFSRERKIAEVEMQRMLAPLTAVIVPTLIMVVICVVTMVSTQMRPTIQPVDIPMPDDDNVDIVETPEEPIPPDDPEPVDVNFVVDAPPAPNVNPSM